MDGSLSSIPPWEGIPVASLTLLAELEELAMNIWGGTGLMDELYGKRPWGSYWLGSNINWSWQRDPGLWLVGEIRSRSIFKGLAKGPGELNVNLMSSRIFLSAWSTKGWGAIKMNHQLLLPCIWAFSLRWVVSEKSSCLRQEEMVSFTITSVELSFVPQSIMYSHCELPWGWGCSDLRLCTFGEMKNSLDPSGRLFDLKGPSPGPFSVR